MGKFFGNLHLVLATGLVLAIVLIYAFSGWTGGSAAPQRKKNSTFGAI